MVENKLCLCFSAVCLLRGKVYIMKVETVIAKYFNLFWCIGKVNTLCDVMIFFSDPLSPFVFKECGV